MPNKSQTDAAEEQRLSGDLRGRLSKKSLQDEQTSKGEDRGSSNKGRSSSPWNFRKNSSQDWEAPKDDLQLSSQWGWWTNQWQSEAGNDGQPCKRVWDTTWQDDRAGSCGETRSKGMRFDKKLPRDEQTSQFDKRRQEQWKDWGAECPNWRNWYQDWPEDCPRLSEHNPVRLPASTDPREQILSKLKLAEQKYREDNRRVCDQPLTTELRQEIDHGEWRMRYLNLDWKTKKDLRQRCQDKAFAEVAKRDFGTPKVVFIQNLLKIATPPELLKMPELHPCTREVILDWMMHMSECHGAMFTKEAIRFFHALPVQSRRPNYTVLMKNDGVLDVPAFHHGRKAGKNASEEECSENDRNWMQYWLQLGGFKHIYEKDANGWNAFHHACDSVTFSPRRAVFAAKAFIAAMKEGHFDEQTWGQSPKNYSALHFLCDGNERYNDKPGLVKMLLKKRANPELKDDSGNTPLLRAAGSGLDTVVQVLLEADVNRYAENAEGKTAHNLAKGCNRNECADLLSKAGVPINEHVRPSKKKETQQQAKWDGIDSVSDVVRRWCFLAR